MLDNLGSALLESFADAHRTVIPEILDSIYRTRQDEIADIVFQTNSYAVDSLLLLVQGNIASYAAKEFQPSFPKGKIPGHLEIAVQNHLNISC